MKIDEVWPEWHEDCVLGEGSFGKVYRVKRVEYGRTFYAAIKEIRVPKDQQEIKYARSQGMNDAEIQNYFRSLVDNLLNEITLMDNLKGAKNIVAIEDYKIIEHCGEIGWDIFIRMELLTPFDNFISNPDFSQIDVIKLGVDICSALEICERSSIIHRDIKPDNIFVSKFGEFKLGDFGIAKKLEGTQANMSRKGTLNFMSPEVYKGQDYGPSVDIYSLGMVMYSLLNNNRMAFLPMYPQPITYKDNEVALLRRMSGDIPNPPCNASPTLGSIVLKACAYNPSDRYQSATEFKNDLLKEWNYLSQANIDVSLNNNYISSGNEENNASVKPTNDMSSNGKILYQDYQTQHFNDGNYIQENSLQNQSEYEDVSVENAKPTQNLIAKIASYVFGVGTILFSLIYLLVSFGDFNKIVALSVMVTGINVLLSNNEKLPVGFSVLATSVPLFCVGVDEFSYEIYGSLSICSVGMIIISLLMFCSGLIIVTQKQVKLGSSFCLYGIVIEVIYFLYVLFGNKTLLDLDITGILICINSQFAIFAWSFGYKTDEKSQGIKRVFFIISLIISILVLLYSIIKSIVCVIMM